MRARILLVEDELNMARTLAKNLERAGHAVEHAPHGEAALARLGQASFDIVLTDLKMPVMDGMALLHAMHERDLPPAVVVLTGYGTIETAVEAMKLGAADYLIKDARPQEILLTIERVLKLDALRRENVRLRQEVSRLHGFGELIGESLPMKEIYRVINTLSENKSTVLVSGESGTGKELVARTIHARGPLAAHPFVAVNCAGLSETLLDSQLFGHRKGSFTGAIDHHQGVFERCSAHGALFLDEIGEVGVPVQIKLLQVLQERTFTTLGGRDKKRFSGRVIAATNRPIAELRQGGRFREDFYYRLCSDVIHVPTLRQRLRESPAELAELVELLVGRTAGASGGDLPGLVLEALERDVPRDYAWPGNVRELEQAVRRILLTGAYRPDTRTEEANGEERLLARLRQGNLTADELLSAYSAMLYKRLGSYAAVAQRMQLDPRTSRKYVIANPEEGGRK